MKLTELLNESVKPVTFKGLQTYTDRNAPDPGDEVMTPDGKGVVVDASQNNDGYYVFFDVSLIDSEEVKHYHISKIKKVPK